MNFPIPRRCAQCGAVHPWKKLWGLSWSNETWPCPNCGAMYKVDMDRRSNLTFISTVFICGLLVMCFNYTWSLAWLALPGLFAIWATDRPVVADEVHHL